MYLFPTQWLAIHGSVGNLQGGLGHKNQKYEKEHSRDWCQGTGSVQPHSRSQPDSDSTVTNALPNPMRVGYRSRPVSPPYLMRMRRRSLRVSPSHSLRIQRCSLTITPSHSLISPECLCTESAGSWSLLWLGKRLMKQPDNMTSFVTFTGLASGADCLSLCRNISGTPKSDSKLAPYSDEFYPEEGVPTGDVLAVTCFGLKINDLPSYIARDIFRALFVDDLAIYSWALPRHHRDICSR